MKFLMTFFEVWNTVFNSVKLEKTITRFRLICDPEKLNFKDEIFGIIEVIFDTLKQILKNDI